uniref:Ras-like GTP-binding protein RhoL n=1 Tax=Clastoptera arizonana TaxID=38151 RepID=A0A1B6DFV4_9HEMI
MASDTKNGGDKPARIRPLKITAVGDGMVGKTCMLLTYTTQEFPTEYVPTVFDNYADNITVDDQDFNIILWDTAGQEDYERLRPLSYPNTNCFLLCYSVGSRSSFENIESKWCPELRHHCPNVPIVLVATKTDLRDEDTNGSKEDNSNDSNRLITPSEGKKLKRRIKAAKFMECSALKNEGLNEIIIEAVRSAVRKSLKKRRTCFCF